MYGLERQSTGSTGYVMVRRHIQPCLLVNKVTGRTGRVKIVDHTQGFDVERPRLLLLAARVLNDRHEAEDIVQTAWLRLHGTESDIESLPAWLTTVTTRLCLDRLRSRTPEPVAEITMGQSVPDPVEDVALAEAVGMALHLVLDRLTPSERVAFVLHDSFGFEFSTIAAVLDTTPAAARKLASRARAKVGQPATEDPLADWEVVDAFMTAAKGETSIDCCTCWLLARPSPPTRPRSSLAPRRTSRTGRRWPSSSTAAPTQPYRCSSVIGPRPRGTTRAKRRSSSTSPSSMAWSNASPSVPSPRYLQGWSAVTGRNVAAHHRAMSHLLGADRQKNKSTTHARAPKER